MLVTLARAISLESSIGKSVFLQVDTAVRTVGRSLSRRLRNGSVGAKIQSGTASDAAPSGALGFYPAVAINILLLRS